MVIHWYFSLTRWVPYDGYIQNDHLSGRMTDISVMGEWQFVSVGGTRPLRNILTRISRDDFRSKVENSSFLSRVMFISKSFFCFPCFCKSWRQTFERWGVWFRQCLEALFETPLGHRASFCELRLRPRVFFEYYLSFFKAEPVLLALQLWWFPGWAKHFGDGMSKVRMKTSLPSVGEIERRRIIDRCRDWYELLVVIYGPKEKYTRKSACDCVKSQPFIIFKTSEFWRTCFQDQMSLPFCTSLFSCTWMYSCRSVRLQCGDSEEKQSSVTFRCWSPRRNELECINLVYWREALYGFSSRDAIMVVGFVLEKHFGGDFTADQEKRSHFQTLATGVPKLKT